MVFGLEFLIALGQTWGLAGAFAIGFLSSFTLFIPSPAFLAVIALAAFINPVALGIATGLGSAAGEMVAYGVGYGAHHIAHKGTGGKMHKDLMKVEKWFKKYQPDAIIFAFAVLPLLPIDALGIFCGAIKYSRNRFFVIVLAGKVIKFTLLALLGQQIAAYFGIDFG
jgi:membrane protein YqaA with SNARE-associated domain